MISTDKIFEEIKCAKDSWEFMEIADRYGYCKGSFFSAYGILLKEEAYVETFTDIYSSLEDPTSFRRLCTERVMEKVKKLNAGKMKDIVILKNSMDETGNITIYRGQNEGSRSYKKALSWTLDKNIANRFSHRINFSNAIANISFPTSAVTYMAKVNIDDIIAYTNDRSEQEVLVEYAKLIKLKGNQRVQKI